MRYFKQTFALTDEEKVKVSEMDGKIMLGILRGDCVLDTARELHLEPWQVEHNIDEMLYTLLKRVGKKRFLRTLFVK